MSDLEFTKLVNQYTKLIFTVCHRFVSDYYEAENLTQETFVTAFRVIDNFIGDNYKPWLVRIATNKCKDYLKSAYVRTTSAVEQETLIAIEDTYSLQNEVEMEEKITLVKRACESLPEPYQEVAVLHFIEDKSFVEIALELGRSVKTVQTQSYRARDKLKVILKEEFSNA
ncbi:MAG: sigma-70 family RNA polymerase sigma factor [Oscillospiraceae bacterium]